MRSLNNEKKVDFSKKNIYLLNDIKLSGQWTSIGTSEAKFGGNFYGNNHTISGLQMNVTSDQQGFFGVTTSKISNLTVVGNIQASKCRRYWWNCWKVL